MRCQTLPDGSSHLLLYERMDLRAGARLLASPFMTGLMERDEMPAAAAATATTRASTTGKAQRLGIHNALATAKCNDGLLPVRYVLLASQHGFGRFKARVDIRATATSGHEGEVEAAPFVYMNRKARGWLAARHYHDVDMVNCHPALMLQIYMAFGRQGGLQLQCPLLQRYVDRRAECLHELMAACGVDRDTAKNLFIRLMFRGGVERWVADNGFDAARAALVPASVHALRAELLRNATAFLASPVHAALHRYMRTRPRDPTAHYNETASTMGIFLQTKERECVEALVDAVHASQRTVGSIIYDGIHVEKLQYGEGDSEATLPEELLDTWRKHVLERTGFDVQLACKAFELDPDWQCGGGGGGNGGDDDGIVASRALVDACAERKAVAGIREALVARWPARFGQGRLDASTFRVTNATSASEGNKIRFSWMDASRGGQPATGEIFSDYSVRVEGDEVPLVGVLTPGLLQAHRLHTSIYRQDLAYVKDLHTEVATLRGTGGQQDTLITIEGMYSASPFLAVKVDGKSLRTTKAMIKALMEGIARGSADLAETTIGGGAGNWFNITFNGPTTINLSEGGGGDNSNAPSLNDKELVDALTSQLGAAGTRHLRFDSLKEKWYMWSAATGAWAVTSVSHVENFVEEGFGCVPGLSSGDRRHVLSRRGRADMRALVGAKLIDDRIESRLDTNLDLFPLRGSVVDVSVRGAPPLLRPTRPEDMVKTFADWEYCAAAAAEHRPDVDRFMSQVFPVAEERDVVLDTLASLLSGHRYDKKFNALTDERSGDNGKSTCLDLIKAVFGDLVLLDNKLVCAGSFDANKHSHDAAFLPVRGKRLLIAEELKSQQSLDTGFLKRVSGGDSTQLGGRGFGTADHFEFVWQARIMLVFNQGDCPKFDAKDAAFVGRMVVVPMRSKFVLPHVLAVAAAASAAAGGGDGGGGGEGGGGEGGGGGGGGDGTSEPHTFPMDMEIKARFPLWRSALLAVMMERYVGSRLAMGRAAPASARSWQASVTQGNNPLAEWLEAHYEVTGSAEDVLLLAEAKSRYDGRACPTRDFSSVAAAYYKGVDGVTYHAQKRVAVGGVGSMMQRNVVGGVRARSMFRLE